VIAAATIGYASGVATVGLAAQFTATKPGVSGGAMTSTSSLSWPGLVDLGCLLLGSWNVARCVATECRSWGFAGICGDHKRALTSGNVQGRMLANVLPLPYKQVVSSSSLLAPTIEIT
jgi:hypothetical protein